MTIKEKKQIEEVLNQFQELKIEEIVTGYVKKNPDAHDVIFLEENYTVAGFVNTITRVILNFTEELKTPSWSSLEVGYDQMAYEKKTIIYDIRELLKGLVSEKIDTSVCFLLSKIVHYQRINNFWHRNDAMVKIEALSEAESLVSSKKALFEIAQKETDEIIKNAKYLAEGLDKIKGEMKKELEKTVFNNESNQSENKKIQDLVNDINKKKGGVDEIAKGMTERADEFKKRIEMEQDRLEQYQKSLGNLEKSAKEKIEEVIKTQKTWDEKLNAIKEVVTFMKGKEEEIKVLTGFAAGVSLFHAFQERKKELQKPVIIWGVGVLLMTIVLITMFVVLFLYNPATTEKGTSWGIFGLNTLRSLPAVILLYFAIRQYNKERAYQEEYAFKSSVALTVNAFADKLSDTKSNKDALIISSVNKVYETPRSMRERGSWFGLKQRVTNETLKNLTEAIKEIKK